MTHGIEAYVSTKASLFSDQNDSENKLRLLASHILNDIESSDCAVVFNEIWAIAERNSGVKKAAPENCRDQQVNNTVAILLTFIEGYCITSSNLNVSTKKLSEQLGLILYKLLN